MNTTSPIVTIISPTYNHEKFIAECIESVIAQTYQSWEMLIIDDGSKDNTYAIGKSYADIDSRIQIFTKENVGIFRLNESYNFGLANSKGKYIAILECDDIWCPDKLEIQIAEMGKNPNAVLSWGRAYLSSIDLKKNYYMAPRNMEDKELFHNKPAGTFLNKFYKTLLPALTIVIRKDALLAIGGFQQGFELPLVDIPTSLELLFNGEFVFVDHLLGHWRIYPHQVTKTFNGQMTLGYYSLMKSLLKRYSKIFKNQNVTIKEIDLHFKASIVISFSRSGRYNLIRKNFKNARKDYWYSISHYGFTEPIWKLRSVVGLCLSFFGLDVEWLAKLIGNESYKS